MTVHLLGISGSLRKNSYNTTLLKTLAQTDPKNTHIEIADISQIPLYNQDHQEQNGIPDAVTQLAQKIKQADMIIFATPEYNYSTSGVLKNTIDFLSRVSPMPFAKKPAGVVGASMGELGSVRAQAHLRQIIIGLNALVMQTPEVFVGGAHKKFDENGNLNDENTHKILRSYMQKALEWIEKTKALTT